jgi:hypothetical protein
MGLSNGPMAQSEPFAKVLVVEEVAMSSSGALLSECEVVGHSLALVILLMAISPASHSRLCQTWSRTRIDPATACCG